MVPSDAEGWVPEHFYAEVLATLRRQALVQKLIAETQRPLRLRCARGGSIPCR